MILVCLILMLLNLCIFFNLKKFSIIVNIYDIPDKKLKLHKKKNSYYWWNNFSDKFFCFIYLSNFFFK